jgi:hypothetical protein
MNIRLLFAYFVALAAPIFPMLQLSAQTSEAYKDHRQPFFLVRNTDPDFYSILREHMPEVMSLPQYPAIRKTSILLVNGSRARLTAVSIQWTQTDTAGKQSVFYTDIFPGPSLTIPLPGFFAVLQPSQVALVTPLAHYEEHSAGSVGIISSPLALAYAESDRVKSLVTASLLTAKIDCAIFRTQVKVGHDLGGLAKRYTCERNAAIAEAQSLVPLLGGTTAELSSKLQQDLKSSAPRGDGGLSDCSYASQHATIRLEGALQNESFPEFRHAVQVIAAAPPANFLPSTQNAAAQ